MNVLFLCTGNSCRSILAEGIFNHFAPAGWHAISAGSQPTGQIHPISLQVLKENDIETATFRSQSWHDLPITPDIVITVCASAAGETCPLYLGQAIRSHWGLADPAKATGTEAQIHAVFEATYAQLKKAILAFFDLPLAQISQDPKQLKCALDRISDTFFRDENV